MLSQSPLDAGLSSFLPPPSGGSEGAERGSRSTETITPQAPRVSGVAVTPASLAAASKWHGSDRAWQRSLSALPPDAGPQEAWGLHSLSSRGFLFDPASPRVKDTAPCPRESVGRSEFHATACSGGRGDRAPQTWAIHLCPHLPRAASVKGGWSVAGS